MKNYAQQKIDNALNRIMYAKTLSDSEKAENKILYSLDKIDYHKRRKSKPLVRVFSAILALDGVMTLKLLMARTGFSRDKLMPLLRELKSYGLLSWEGKYLAQDKVITSEKPEFREWYDDLQRKLRGESTALAKKVDDSIVIEKDKKEEKIKIKCKCEVDDSEEWVEIQYSEDVILKVKKKKIKEAFL